MVFWPVKKKVFPLSWPEIPQAPCSRRLLPLADENLCLGTQNPKDNAHPMELAAFERVFMMSAIIVARMTTAGTRHGIRCFYRAFTVCQIPEQEYS